MEQRARVVQLHTTAGTLSMELYDNFCADSFWQLASSGQLKGLTFTHLLPGYALLGSAEGVYARCTTARDLDTLKDAPEPPQLRHVGAGLLSCRPSVGEVAGSRVLVTLSPQPALDATQVVLGRVYSGMQTVSQMAKMQADADFVLYTPVTVLRCTTTLLPRGTPPGVREDDAKMREYRVQTLSNGNPLALLD